jgi:putative component of toxin-antitoxin plasmid stabilization module
MVYNSQMIEIRETDDFSDWFAALSDAQARTRIQARILRLRSENAGDASR